MSNSDDERRVTILLRLLGFSPEPLDARSLSFTRGAFTYERVTLARGSSGIYLEWGTRIPKTVHHTILWPCTQGWFPQVATELLKFLSTRENPPRLSAATYVDMVESALGLGSPRGVEEASEELRRSERELDRKVLPRTYSVAFYWDTTPGSYPRATIYAGPHEFTLCTDLLRHLHKYLKVALADGDRCLTYRSLEVGFAVFGFAVADGQVFWSHQSPDVLYKIRTPYDSSFDSTLAEIAQLEPKV